ncbi:MAG TPA: protein-disulfide reductase DsbD [Steroidobacteraceae bacterium]|jgi:thiol:disulfide interchange protein DsbD
MQRASIRHNASRLVTLAAALAAASLLPTAQLHAATTGSSSAIDAALSPGTGQSGDNFLPPDEAFRFDATADGPDRVRLVWEITDGYYLYRARIKASTTSDRAQLGELVLPRGETKIDDYFGKQEVYHHQLVGSVTVARPGGATFALPLKVTYQGCATAGLCYPPITKTINVSLPPGTGATGGTSALEAAATAGSPLPADGTPGQSAAGGSASGAASAASAGFVSEQDRLGALLRDGNLAAVLATFFALGALLSLSPCVLPMIPILSGIIVGQGERVTAGRGFSLAFIYVQGMALTYAAAGAAFVLAFKQAPQAFFQQPWILMLFVLLFVALALAMFGTYTLQMPSGLQTRLTNLSNRQKTGTYIGTFIMGALSALVVTACVAPALIAALSVISQSGRVARGALALYVTGLGMGLPLLLVGASAGSLLPKVGPWMDTVKSLFGVLFLGVAIYFLRSLVSPAVTMLLWSALAVISGFWVFALRARDGGPAPAAVRAAGLLGLVYGVILLIGVAAGSQDPLQPLSTLRVGTTVAASMREPALEFANVKSVEDLQRHIAAASAAGKPVMLDFYADWCVSCKEMDKYTFSDPTVQVALSHAVLLHADVTRNDEQDQALLRHLGILGPPTIAFYGPDGQERRNFRVVGYMKAADFAALVHRALGTDLSASIRPVSGTM